MNQKGKYSKKIINYIYVTVYNTRLAYIYLATDPSHLIF